MKTKLSDKIAESADKFFSSYANKYTKAVKVMHKPDYSEVYVGDTLTQLGVEYAIKACNSYTKFSIQKGYVVFEAK